jgi:hypothetical protein
MVPLLATSEDELACELGTELAPEESKERPSWKPRNERNGRVGHKPGAAGQPVAGTNVRSRGAPLLGELFFMVSFPLFVSLSRVSSRSRVTPPRRHRRPPRRIGPTFGGHIQKNETSLVTAGATFAAQAHDRMQCATMRHGRLQARFAGWQKRCKLPPENTFRSVVADGQLPFCALHTGLCIDQPCEYCTVWHPLACISTWRASAETASG